MNAKLANGISLGLAALSLVLLIVNVALINSNRNLQDSANQRQADINKAASLTNINQGLIQALADAAVNNNDTAIKDLLAAQGITINPGAKSNSEKK